MEQQATIVFILFVIFAGAAVLATAALFTRQSLLVAYIVLGVILGPWGLKVIYNPQLLHYISEIGIIFLLFLLGTQMPAQKLLSTLKSVAKIWFISSIIFLAVGFGIAKAVGFSNAECWVIGAAMMFSSTIIGIKLLPTTVLHHQRLGEIMIGILLLQDLLAIAVLMVIDGFTQHGFSWVDIILVLVGLPALIIFAFTFERCILIKLFLRFNKVREYIFLLALGWCLTVVELAHYMGLSQVGAFIAGVSLAGSPISFYIAESLKPVRDFFLILFFFSVGANFNLQYLHQVMLPAAVLGMALLVVKPAIYRWLLVRTGEVKTTAWEIGFRLGQASEFSLIVASSAVTLNLIHAGAAYFIQATSILTFIASSYFVVSQYTTPMASVERLRRD